MMHRPPSFSSQRNDSSSRGPLASPLSAPQSVSEFAERVLLGTSLLEKLTPPPPGLALDPPRRGTFAAPDLPGRPDDLRPRSNNGKSRFPSPAQISNEEQRGLLLHFFANHELLAVELMALALLKFPDAPDSFRKGVLRTLQEEQQHTRWYLDRMAACGLTLGDHHLSPMIWSHISSMESPLDYVSRLSLTFEQANLDYAHYYSKLLARVGDHDSAHLLARIYKDEIAHVGYGLKWLRRWKQNAQSDWDAWHQRLHFPLSPIRAKGLVPFNEEGRRKAGLKDDFIARLKRFQTSRGRSPDLYWFNPDVELAAASPAWKPPKRIDELAADLENAFALAAPTADDLVLLRKEPSSTLRESLAVHDLHFPETAPLSRLEEIRQTRKIRFQCPWGQPDEELLSKQTGLELRRLVDPSPLPATLCQKLAEVRDFLELHQDHPKWFAKPILSAAGRGHFSFSRDNPPDLKAPHLIEPRLKPIFEFSLLYQANPADEGGLRFLGLSRQSVSATGQWQSSTSAPKPATGLPRALALMVAHEILPAAKKEIARSLQRLVEARSYRGPVCIDSFIHQTPDGPAWHRVSEVNARWSMGRLAHNLRLKLCPNRGLTLTTIAKGAPLPKNALPLAAPETVHARLPIVIISSDQRVSN